ncbi:MAG: MerR family transcriptional regulator [Gemmatimonadota bacterium]
MRELTERSGLPRTTIHHYLREGLLPPPEKTAANAAVYGPPHLERLALLKALRGAELGPLAVEEIRRVLPLVERGIAPADAVELAALSSRVEGDDPDVGPDASPDRRLSLRDLARRASREVREIRALVEAGVLRGAGATDRFDGADLAAAVSCGRLLDAGLAAEDLGPVASLLRDATAYESALLDLATAERDPEEADALREPLRRAFGDLHAYLLARGAGA